MAQKQFISLLWAPIVMYIACLSKYINALESCELTTTRI